MTYPNGKVINYIYNAGLDATISRLTNIGVSGSDIEGYSYVPGEILIAFVAELKL